MCGIAGFFVPCGFQNEWGLDIAKKMGLAIINRGPDSSGEWIDGENGIAFAHRRLSILDLSPAGYQPMVSHSKRYVIILNGEIYNHQHLRGELKNVNWRGQSDTETLLECFDKWGFSQTLSKTVGMFAMALWDRRDRCLYIARDRMGEKPLYYGWHNNRFLFGSELKSLHQHPDFIPEINKDVLPLYLRHSYIPAPYSIYKGIFKLKPGTYLRIDKDNKKKNEPETYWSLKDQVTKQKGNFSNQTLTDSLTQLEKLLIDAVKLQSIADVPLGAFLSGGIDSSLIVSLMQAHSSCPVKTFTIGFNESKYDEAVFAKAVSKYLKTEHTELYLTSNDLINTIPELPNIYDEPFADSSQIPTYLVSKLARQHVTVSLSGDAGDELFGGYTRYYNANKWYIKNRQVPPFLKSLNRKLSQNTSPEFWDKFISPLSFGLSSSRFNGRLIDKFVRSVSANTFNEYYAIFLYQMNNLNKVVLNTENEYPPIFKKISDENINNNFVEWMMYQDCLTYLPDDILVKVDRAAMGVSLETRVPLLDHRIVEFAWGLPFEHKVFQGQSKYLLKQLLYKYIPKQLIERKKAGFSIPLNTWLKHDLRDWVEESISFESLSKAGFFEPTLIRKIWQQHLKGKYNWEHQLWSVLVFQNWLKYNRY